MSSNYPPNVNESDIPGSRPEDVEMEKFMDDFFTSLTKEESDRISGRLPWIPEANSLFEKAIQFGIERGKEEQLRIFAENRFYQAEYMEDRFSSILRMLYWRIPSSVNFYFVCDWERKEEKWEVIVYFGAGGGESRTSGVHSNLGCAVEKLFNDILELTKGDEALNQELIRRQKEANGKDKNSSSI